MAANKIDEVRVTVTNPVSRDLETYTFNTSQEAVDWLTRRLAEQAKDKQIDSGD